MNRICTVHAANKTNNRNHFRDFAPFHFTGSKDNRICEFFRHDYYVVFFQGKVKGMVVIRFGRTIFYLRKIKL